MGISTGNSTYNDETVHKDMRGLRHGQQLHSEATLHNTKRLTRVAECSEFTVFVDLDAINAFHQIRLSKETSDLFMPKGVSPASGVRMTVMREIFIDFNEWMIVIHDNLLVCSHDYDDAYRKLQLVIDRAYE
jgi:hypothetical protein